LITSCHIHTINQPNDSVNILPTSVYNWTFVRIVGVIFASLLSNVSNYQIAQLVTKTANGFIRQDHKFFTNALHQKFVAATGKIGPADTKIK
jgi:hypothetical protein